MPSIDSIPLRSPNSAPLGNHVDRRAYAGRDTGAASVDSSARLRPVELCVRGGEAEKDDAGEPSRSIPEVLGRSWRLNIDNTLTSESAHSQRLAAKPIAAFALSQTGQRGSAC